MYRIFCESYKGFLRDFEGAHANEYRYEIAKPLELITEIDLYNREKEAGSQLYKQLSDLLVYMGENIERYPKFEAFLWTLESRGIIGVYHGITDTQKLEEQAKLINMFLNLAYWIEAV